MDTNFHGFDAALIYKWMPPKTQEWLVSVAFALQIGKTGQKRKFQNTRFTESNLHCQPSAMSHCHCVHQSRCRAAETFVQSQHCTHYQSQSMWIDLPQLEPLLKLVVEWLHRQKFETNELTTPILLLHGKYFSACSSWSPFLSCICLALIMTMCTGYHACTKLYEALYSILL